MPGGSDALLPSTSTKVRISVGAPGVLAWYVYKCASTAYGSSERPPGIICEETEISSLFRVYTSL